MNSPLFFFTAEDPREIPKGSRDPLRFLPVWSKVARRMIPYLTTVTPSYRGFLTRLLFHASIENINPRLANGSKKEQWEAFNKFEQLCAIVRSHTNPATPNFPGKSNILSRNKDNRAVVGSSIDYWLMRSQENTGFWGYYHQASLGSKLLQHNTHPNPGYLLTDTARNMLERSYASSLIYQYKSDLKILFEQKNMEFAISHFTDLGRLFAQKTSKKDEIEWQLFWQKHLLTPEVSAREAYDSSIQNQFAESVASILVSNPVAKEAEIWEQLSKSDNDELVVHHAQAVRSTEAVIGLCEWVFDACRLRKEGGESLKKAESWALQNGYNLWLEKLRHIAEPSDLELRMYRDIALTHEHSFEPLAQELIKRHQNIMQQRKGAPWVELLEERILRVREICSEPNTPNLDAGSSGIKWRYDYFLGSWISVARELGFIREKNDE